MKTRKLVYCDMTTEGGGWTVINKRMDGSVDFYRSWDSYKEGFGNVEGEYWLGNEAIHLLTKRKEHELRVDLQKFTGEKAFAKYSKFTVGSESQKFKLTATGYSGTAGDSLAWHNGRPFSTKDADNDSSKKYACAVRGKAGWWFNSCDNSNLNGPYHKSAVKSDVSINWDHFGKGFSLKTAKMMTRPDLNFSYAPDPFVALYAKSRDACTPTDLFRMREMTNNYGNEHIHLITKRSQCELRVDLQKFFGKKAFAKYSIFTVGSESQKFKLTATGYSGTAVIVQVPADTEENMVLFKNNFVVLCFFLHFSTTCCITPHSHLQGNVESLLKLTRWNWKHLNTSVKVDTPVSVDISLLSHYRLTGKHFNKYQKVQKQRDCASILKFIPNTKGKDGVYAIYPDMRTKILVYCDMTTEGGGWTVINKRIDGSVDFYRSWDSYKEGFGNVEGEYYLGNEAIHLLTKKRQYELRVDLQKFSGKKAFAKYSKFSVGSESQKFKLTVTGYSGTAGSVESLLKLTPWNWKHLNTSVKVDTPVSVDISLLSHYRLTGKHFNKYQKVQKQRDCASILKFIPNTKGKDGVYAIYPDMKTKKLVYCDMTTEGGGWTVINRRMDGSVDFYRSWDSYKEGFGNVEGEYWLGNEAIHLLTKGKKHELRVDLQKFTGEKAFAKYSKFSVGSESQKFKLTATGYSGTAGDSLAWHNGRPFSTKDADNDSSKKYACAVRGKAGWWFNSCDNSNLNGPYHKSAVKSDLSINWDHFGKGFSLKTAKMMSRPVK
ncbi:uncharacterized protein LOC134230101 [Saccostrea cucullata]|uniref:uncharacterized protein LOC134230101 n=1 Tax=Saccostrea cuccullata TaxID=36930 RepID=UPI002ED06BCB